MPVRADARVALRRMSAEYIRSRRASGDLRTRLVSAVHERARLVDGVEISSDAGRLQRQLAEIDHVRGTLERSAQAAAERVRALEAVIAATVRVSVRPDDRPSPAPATDAPGDLTVTDAAVRGGWSPPA